MFETAKVFVLLRFSLWKKIKRNNGYKAGPVSGEITFILFNVYEFYLCFGIDHV